MTAGIYPWEALGPIEAPVLLVLNSSRDAAESATAVCAALEKIVPAPALHVVAGREWTGWLSERGIPLDRVLFCEDYEGRDIEVNYFLESPAAVLWTAERRFAAIIGADAYDLHNERVNEIFEQRALLLIGDGVLLAHTLPTPYVYVFDTPALLERCGRGVKLQAYERASRSVIDDLHALWIQSGRPAVSDDPGFDDVLGILTRRLGASLVAYDETGPIPLPHESLTGAFADVIGHVRTVVREHDRQLRVWSDAYAERKEAADVREAGVKLRDDIIDDLRLQLEPWHRKLRRRWRERRG